MFFFWKLEDWCYFGEVGWENGGVDCGGFGGVFGWLLVVGC